MLELCLLMQTTHSAFITCPFPFRLFHSLGYIPCFNSIPSPRSFFHDFGLSLLLLRIKARCLVLHLLRTPSLVRFLRPDTPFVLTSLSMVFFRLVRHCFNYLWYGLPLHFCFVAAHFSPLDLALSESF